MAKEKKETYKVREGYVFYKGRRGIKAGEVLTLTDEEVKGQEWKLEKINPKAKPQNKAIEKPPQNKAVEKPPQNKAVEKPPQNK